MRPKATMNIKSPKISFQTLTILAKNFFNKKCKTDILISTIADKIMEMERMVMFLHNFKWIHMLAGERDPTTESLPTFSLETAERLPSRPKNRNEQITPNLSLGPLPGKPYLKEAGYESTKYGLHSFHSGGVTTAANEGIKTDSSRNTDDGNKNLQMTDTSKIRYKNVYPYPQQMVYKV